MIVDDDLWNLACLKLVLNKIFSNIEIIQAINGEDGFNKFVIQNYLEHAGPNKI